MFKRLKRKKNFSFQGIKPPSAQVPDSNPTSTANATTATTSVSGQATPANSGLNEPRKQTATKNQKVSKYVEDNQQFFLQLLDKNIGIISRPFKISKNSSQSAYIIAVSGMVEITLINENILRPLMKLNSDSTSKYSLTYLKESALSIAQIKFANNLFQIADDIFTGKVALFLEGEEQALIIDAQAWEMRAISESETETVIRGPRDSFTEDITTILPSCEGNSPILSYVVNRCILVPKAIQKSL